MSDNQLLELTDKNFWDNYWKNCPIPNVVRYEFSFERCLAREIKRYMCTINSEHKTILEIGCSPGKWLAFFSKEFKMVPSGIDYSKEGIKATESNLKHLGLNFGDLQFADFFTLVPDKQYDVVISLGFIEHFDNPDKVVELHLNWLKPGGFLMLGVPNFNGVYKIIQGALSPEILEKHNLDIMNLNYFRGLASKFDLQLEQLGYLGSFEPALLIDANKIPNKIQIAINVFLKIAQKVRRLKFIDYLNNRFISSYIFAVYKKND